MTAHAARLLWMLVAGLVARPAAHAHSASAPSPLQQPQRAVPALLPPEIPASLETGIGLQVRFEGRHAPQMDSQRQRDILRAQCRAKGSTYVNDAPLDSHGRFQEWKVQLGMRSYTWYEGQVVRASPDDFCRWEVARLRKLTVAVYDGRRTTLHEYDYETRTLQVHTREGDLTALGAEMPANRVSRSSITDFPVAGRQVIATVGCTEHLIPVPGTQDGSGHLRCITGMNPFDGRRSPLILKDRIGDARAPMTSWQAVEILPRVEVNQLTFRGPPFFRLVGPPQARRGRDRAVGTEQ